MGSSHWPVAIARTLALTLSEEEAMEELSRGVINVMVFKGILALAAVSVLSR